MVRASGSAKTVEASEKEKPCLFKFSEALASSHSKVKLIPQNIRCFGKAGKASNDGLQRLFAPRNLTDENVGGKESAARTCSGRLDVKKDVY